ncbi:MAG: response regulator [Acidobacteriota bacterium]
MIKNNASRAVASNKVVKTDKVNILLVDDQPAKLLSYEVILSALDENLIKAGSAREALEYLLKIEVAVVLIDVSMPELDGFELAAIIREHPRYEKTAIIFVSGVHLTDLDRLKGYQCGAVDYVSVPIVPEILRAKVSVFADLYRKTQQLEQLNCELERRVEERTAKLGESEAQFRAMFDMAAVGQAQLDVATGRFVRVNQRFCAITGYELDELLSMTATDLIYPDDRDEDITTYLSVIEGESEEYLGETRYVRKNGEVIWVNIAARLIRDNDGRALRTISTIQDITIHKQIEQEREKMLIREQRARKQIEEASLLKDEFIATISHELRTPLTAMFGWIRLLRTSKLDENSRERAMETIERNARAQNQLIEDLLDMSRIINGKLKLDIQPVDLKSVIETAVSSVRPAVDAKEINLQMFITSVGPVNGDSGRLQQVIWNLLSNAIKFTPRGGRVEIRLNQIDSQAQITIRDTGQGISSDFLPYVFDRFRQADASITRSVGGLGLGLAIVRHLVELHGGTIEAESDGVGKGATFRLKLLLKPGNLVSKLEDDRPLISDNSALFGHQISLKGISVLVIEDEADTRDMLALILRQYEAEVRATSSASQAIEIFKQWLPDVLVSDIAMPEIDGYELIQLIRDLPVHQGGRIPAIALTAHAKSEDRLRALSTGFNMHVAKPIEPIELITVIANLVSFLQK